MVKESSYPRLDDSQTMDKRPVQHYYSNETNNNDDYDDDDNNYSCIHHTRRQQFSHQTKNIQRKPPLILPYWTVGVKNKRIYCLAPTKYFYYSYHTTNRLDLSARYSVLLPGLVNGHSHAALSLLRGYADDLKLTEWLEDYIWPTEAKFLSPEFVYDGALAAAYEMLKTGTTMTNDMYFMYKESKLAFHKAGLRLVSGPVVLDVTGNSHLHMENCWNAVNNHSKDNKDDDDDDDLFRFEGESRSTCAPRG